jgi:hypothetical protein
MRSSLVRFVFAGLFVALIILSTSAVSMGVGMASEHRVFAHPDRDRQTVFFGFGGPFFGPWGYDYGYPYYYPANVWTPPQPVYFTDKIMGHWINQKTFRVLWIGDTRSARGVSVIPLDGSRKVLSIKPRDIKSETYAVTLKVPKHTAFIGIKVFDPNGGVVSDLVEPLPIR